jgi:hypothetical protein
VISKDEVIRYCHDNLDVIFVRTRKDGKWGSYALRELPEDEVARFIDTWYSEQWLPIRLLES